MSTQGLLVRAPPAEDLGFLKSFQQNPPLLSSSFATPCSSLSLLPSRLDASLKALSSLTTFLPEYPPVPLRRNKQKEKRREAPPSSAATSGSSPADLLLLSLSPLASLLCFSPHSFASLGVATSGFQCPTNKKIIWDQRLALHLHPIENQVVGLAKTLEEVINLLPLDTSVVVIALAEPKVNLREKENLSLNIFAQTYHNMCL